VFFAVFGLIPQIGLWLDRGEDWNGTYAVIAYDEPAYAAYLQSIIEGKPRRNSPYSGRIDSPETPQKESLFSIQFFSAYPLAIAARFFGLSSSTAMILLSGMVGFSSAFIIFWLFYLFSKNSLLSFIGTVTVLFGGSLAAGQGSFFSLILADSALIDRISMPFLRRTNPAVSFPILFLFFMTVWKFLNTETKINKTIWAIASVVCFSATVYSYFYHWTTALAWFLGLVILWAVFQFADFRQNIIYFLGIGLAMLIVLIPYFVLLSNRAANMDSVQLLVYSRSADLWRAPELISYAAISLLLISYKRRWLDLDKSAYIFLLSFTLIAPIVFNQQILTNRSLQPFHYQLFCVNYISAFVLLLIILMLMAKKMNVKLFRKTSLLIGLIALFIGCQEIVWGNYFYQAQRVWMDKLTPAAQRIKSIREGSEFASSDQPPIVMSFDLSHEEFFNSTNLPSLSSQAILWSVHLSMFPDIDENENILRLNKFLYYQNFDAAQLKKEIEKNRSVALGFFGSGRIYPVLTSDANPITEEEINKIVEKYEDFRQNFSFKDAQTHQLSFVLVNGSTKPDLSSIDRWYERDNGETIGDYTLFQVKLRRP
jgi:hypothetical protein